MRSHCAFFVSIVTLALVPVMALGMTSTNYQIPWDSINVGGDDIASSTNYKIRDTLGEVASGTSTSATYGLAAGYRGGVGAGDELSLVLRTQVSDTNTRYAALSIALGTVTVSSTASFSVNDYIAAIENSGFSERVAVGKITAVDGVAKILTVDRWEGATGTMSAAPSGTGNYVYLLSSANALAFGTVVAGATSTAIVMTSVSSNVTSGYAVYLQADQILKKTGGTTIAGVADGTVTLNAEEYGASVTGTHAFAPDVDTAVTTTQRIVQTSATSTGSTFERAAMTYKLSISSTTPVGTYGQMVYYTLTATY